MTGWYVKRNETLKKQKKNADLTIFTAVSSYPEMNQILNHICKWPRSDRKESDLVCSHFWEKKTDLRHKGAKKEFRLLLHPKWCECSQRRHQTIRWTLLLEPQITRLPPKNTELHNDVSADLPLGLCHYYELPQRDSSATCLYMQLPCAPHTSFTKHRDLRNEMEGTKADRNEERGEKDETARQRDDYVKYQEFRR